MAVETTPHNSWVVYSTGERNQLSRPQYRLRSKYILTKDPLPVMNYKQIEKALLSKYDIPSGPEESVGLDTSFGINGYNLATPGTNDNINSIVLQSGGKIVAGGYATISSKFVFAVARYNSDGSLDTSFGTDGYNLNTPGTSDNINSIVFQSDGKIVAGGYATISSTPVFAVARYNSNGSLDTTFGTNGFSIITPGTGDRINSMVLQSDGKIVAGGSATISGKPVFAVARYNSNGSLDTTFGTNGYNFNTPRNYSDGINSIVLQSDGKIVAGGTSGIMVGNSTFAIARYNSDGSLDTTFGTNGFNVFTPGSGTSFSGISSVIIQSDGKIVAGGYAIISGTNNVFAISRYSSNGSLDITFGTNGSNITTPGTNDGIRSLAFQLDGKIVAGGHAVTIKDGFVVARYNSDGSIDTTFGTNGFNFTTPGTADRIRSIIFIFNLGGQLIVCGYATISGKSLFALTRYNL